MRNTHSAVVLRTSNYPKLFDAHLETTISPTLAEKTDREWDEEITFIIEFKKIYQKKQLMKYRASSL